MGIFLLRLVKNLVYQKVLLSDKKNMSIKEYFSLIIHVITNLKVILTVVVMLLVIEFAKFITTYKKKPPKPKVKKEKTPAPKPEEKKEGEEKTEEKEAGASGEE